MTETYGFPTAADFLPGETPGVVQEIKWIRDQKIWGRLVLLMPQEDRSIKWSERWTALRARIAKEGLDLPEYRACGLIFMLGQTGRMELFQPVKLGYKDLGQGALMMSVTASSIAFALPRVKGQLRESD
ncbi:MAG: hypothetical protein ACJ746_24995 [Bryobacteraceae bacterium]